MIHIENSSIRVLIRKTVLNLEPRIRALTSLTTQQHFRVLTLKTGGLMTLLAHRDDRFQHKYLPVHCFRLRLIHVLYFLLGLLFAGFAYSTMGWSEPLFDTIINKISQIDQTGAHLQRVNTHIQRLGLSVLLNNPHVAKYSNSALLLEYMASASLFIHYPHEPLDDHHSLSEFTDQLLSYNLCQLPEMLAIPDIAVLCQNLELTSEILAAGSFPFPDVLSVEKKGKQILNLRFLTTIVKNRLTEMVATIETDSFLAIDPLVIQDYMASCLTVSNYLFAWSLFRDMAMVP